MPPFINSLEIWTCFTRARFTLGWLSFEVLVMGLMVWLVGCRVAVSSAFRFSKAQKTKASDLLRHWAYHRPTLLRVSQSPACKWVGLVFAGMLLVHLGVLYPSAGARSWAFVHEADKVRMGKDPAEVQHVKLTDIAAWQHPWLAAARHEARLNDADYWTPYPRSWEWKPGHGDARTEAAAIIHQAHAIELGGLLVFLLSLTFAYKAWSREATGESHHGRSSWASRAEVACKVVNGAGYFKIPMQVSQDGSRRWEKAYTAPFTVLAPSAKSNCGHGLIIGPTGSGKGAFTFGHIFATATVPIIYQDAKGECPAWPMRPQMIRFGIPANKPKGMPSMRHNPIAEIHREGLTDNQRADRARILASLLLPTPAEKNANSWINETAQPLLAMGLLQGRWTHLGELADEIEGHPLPYLLSCLSVAAGRVFSLAGKNVMEYASNELANNTAPYLRGWARHAFSDSDFTMADFWARGAYIMAATESPREKLPINLFWNLVWNDAQASDKPLPCLVLLDECVAAGRIPGIVSATVKLRDRGFSIWMAFQTYAGIRQVYGNDEGEALRRALVNTIILTNGLDSKDAAEVVEEMGHWTHTEKNQKAGTTSRTKFPLLPHSDLVELAGQEDEFWAIIRGRGMSRKGRPILGKLYPIAGGQWNCLATEEEYRAEEERYGHFEEAESRYSYTLTHEYRKAATLALRLADGDGNKAIALFEMLEKSIADQGLTQGTSAFTNQVLSKGKNATLTAFEPGNPYLEASSAEQVAGDSMFGIVDSVQEEKASGRQEIGSHQTADPDSPCDDDYLPPPEDEPQADESNLVKPLPEDF